MNEVIEVRRAQNPISASVRPPGSKSATIRALAAASLAAGRSHIYGALRADDSEAMLRVVRGFGIDVDDGSDPWAVDGLGGHLSTPSEPIDVGESGLSARIAVVLAAFAEGTTTLVGRGRLNERPMQSVIDILHDQGVDVHGTNGRLPITVAGQGGLWGGKMKVDCSKSSQYATAVLLVSPLTSEPTSVRLVDLAGSSRYLDMTIELMESFGARVAPNITGFDAENHGYQPGDYVVEPDASAAVYPAVAAAITRGTVVIEGLRMSTGQPDMRVVRCLQDMGCAVESGDGGVRVTGPQGSLNPIHVDMSEAPDGSLGLAVACLYADGESRIDGLHSLQYKESDRLQAIATEMRSLGGDVTIQGDSLVIRGSSLSASSVHSHGDHRIAMAMALAGLNTDGVVVHGAGAVSKTWPHYWEMLETLATSSI